MYGSVPSDPRKMNSGVTEKDDGFPGIGNQYLLCPIAFGLTSF